MGWGVDDIAPMAEFPNTTVICRFGTDFGIGHGLFPTDIKFRNEIIVVPQLEQSDIQTDMGRVQATVLGKLGKHPVQVLDIVDLFQT